MTNSLDANLPIADSAESRARPLHGLDAGAVYGIWHKALERRHTDPEGAIAIAHSLLEKICRLVLEERGIAYSKALDLPVLMKMTVEQLSLAPTGASETAFKRMLGSAASVVDGLWSRPAKPSAHHAQLAANIAGTAALFVVETWEARIEEEFFELIDDSKGG